MSLGDLMLKFKDFLVNYGGFVFLLLGIALLCISGWRIFWGLVYQDMFKFEAIMCILGIVFGILFIYFGYNGIEKLGELGDKIVEDNIDAIKSDENENDEDLPWYLQDNPDIDSVKPAGMNDDSPDDGYTEPSVIGLD